MAKFIGHMQGILIVGEASNLQGGIVQTIVGKISVIGTLRGGGGGGGGGP